MNNLNINIFDLIIILGAIQGLLLSLFLYRKETQKSKALIFLTLFIFGFSINSLFFSLEGLGFRGKNFTHWMEFLPMLCSLLIIPSFYLFVEFLIHPKRDYNSKDFLLFGPYLFQFFWQLILLILSFKNEPFLREHVYQIIQVNDIIDIVALIYGWMCLILSLYKINQYEEAILENYAEVSNISLAWVKRLILLLIIILILWSIPTLYEIIWNRPSLEIFYPMWIGMSVLIYWIGYTMYFKKDGDQVELVHEEKITPNPSKALSEKTELYYQSLIQLMETEKPYLNQDLNLKILALQLNLSGGYLSQIINQYEQKNFFDFVNSYRVKTVKEKMTDASLDHLSLLGIAFESGFKSKSTFNLSFKKLTGQTPTQFKKSLK